MKCSIKIFLIPLTMTMLSANADVINVNFKSTVNYSEDPTILIGETIDISLTYDTTASYDGTLLYSDTSTGSNITATFENGLIVNTNPTAVTKLDMEMFLQSSAINPEAYRYGSYFHSVDSISNTTVSVMQLNLMFGKQVDVYPDFTLRTEWDDHLSTFLVKDFNVNIDGMNVKSEITEISSAPESPVTVDVATYSDHISPLGGRLYFISDVINTAPNLIEIKRWAYITWPDGTHYNHNSPKKVILDPMDQDIQTSAYFNVPSYWPSGTYEYHLNSIVVKGGLDEEGTVSHDSFTFIKD